MPCLHPSCHFFFSNALPPSLFSCQYLSCPVCIPLFCLLLSYPACIPLRVGNRILFRKNSTDGIQNSSLYSEEESAHSKAFQGLRKSQAEAGLEQNYVKKITFTNKSCSSKQNSERISSTKCFGTEFREFAFMFVPQIRIPICFLFRKWFRTEFQVFASIFAPRNRIPSCFLVRRMLHDRKSESLLLLLFHRTEF
jgi:hypothetical protein